MAVAPSGNCAGELEAHDLRNQHRHRLAEHRGLRLDAAHAPAEHAEAVHHRCVRVGSDQRVRERLAVARLHHSRQVLQVHLVADPGVGRHHLEVVERRLAPAQERVALLVALELELGVALEREPLGEHVHLDRVVDHELHRHQRVDLGGIPAKVLHGVAHRGQVDDRRHACEVLHQHARRPIGDLVGGLVLGGPRRHGLHALVLAVSQKVLEQHLQRVRQAGHVELLLKRVEPEDLIRLAADLDGRTCAESVRPVHAATAVGARARMLWGAPAAASGLLVAAKVASAAVSNGRTVVSPELVISSRVCLRLPT